ncbi:hypothetical protein [Fluviispira multicolorata]|uniref:Uncharacterized protein n=1 Tax=Fluviispira multicolorata TaxID=2654512 RepID=A0A833N2M9_9BACT|nr:hypothetical protein [Fluviispira multicolorata]KAB8028486.1 hypothetical protein GCL57_12235 [Fluviispira multicolorata]
MKLKFALSFLSILSASAFANSTHNLNTVIHSGNIDNIVNVLVNLFNQGTLDQSYPIKIDGTYELNDQNKLVSFHVKENAFRIHQVPLIGTYQTRYSISANIVNGNCKEAQVSNFNIIEGIPSIANPIFSALLNRKGDKAIRLVIKNSGLSAYCNNNSNYILDMN